MEGYIKSIKYIKVNKLYGYWKVTLVDDKENIIGTFGNENLSDPYNFRRETFGILSVINCFDLLKIGSSKPNPIEVTLESDKYERTQKIINKNGISLEKTTGGLYINRRTILDNLLNKNQNQKYKARIENITSQSLTFGIFLMTDYFGTVYSTSTIYYGFGYPLTTSENINFDDLLKACLIFSSYIKSLLKFYKTDDLMKLCNCKELKYPKVKIITDESENIMGMQSIETDMSLIDNKTNYEITDELEKIKTLKK